LTSARKEIWKAWIPALIWLGVIVLESTNLGSAEHTFRYLYPLFHFLFGMDRARFLVWNHALRKTGHVVGYSVLSWLLFRAWRATIPVGGRRVPLRQAQGRPSPASKAHTEEPAPLPAGGASPDLRLLPPRWSFAWARVSFLMTALVASLDEWHQSYLPSRTGRWQDAVLDSCAALAAQLLLWLFLSRSSN